MRSSLVDIGLGFLWVSRVGLKQLMWGGKIPINQSEAVLCLFVRLLFKISQICCTMYLLYATSVWVFKYTFPAAAPILYIVYFFFSCSITPVVIFGFIVVWTTATNLEIYSITHFTNVFGVQITCPGVYLGSICDLV